ncbi:anti-sigma-I factor RsgI family protein [Metabacillus indicus]|uniref:anti-sigma-I factor RsgI family protein n=1 Tax=Metabacillus indicus TaxID=246786 RepID=UPI002490969E|nr:anti-sigma factor domain-containing protein [Metabacillus indicus]
MKKGIVVDRNDDYVTLLTPDGQFLKAAKQKRSYELGEEITFFQLSDTSERASKSVSMFNLRGIRNGLLAVAALILIFLTVLPVLKDDRVYAYMTIDINPSFELQLNEELKVIRIEPMNEDGKAMLAELKDMNKRSVSDVFSTIVDKSKSLGYLTDDKEIFVTTVTADDKHEETKKKMLADVVRLKESYKEQSLNVQAVETDVETRNKAVEQGISTGKYVKLQKTEEADPAVKEDAEKRNEEEKADKETEPAKEESPETVPPVKDTPPSPKKDKEKPGLKEDENKEINKKPAVPDPPKEKETSMNTNKQAGKEKTEAEKARKEAEKARKEREKEKKRNEEKSRDDDDDDERDGDSRDDSSYWNSYSRDRDDDREEDEENDNDNDDDDNEGSRSDRD